MVGPSKCGCSLDGVSSGTECGRTFLSDDRLISHQRWAMQLDVELYGTFPETTHARFAGLHLWFVAVAVDFGRSRKPDAQRRSRMELGSYGHSFLSGALSMRAFIARSCLLQKAIDPQANEWRAVGCRSCCGSNPGWGLAFPGIRGQLSGGRRAPDRSLDVERERHIGAETGRSHRAAYAPTCRSKPRICWPRQPAISDGVAHRGGPQAPGWQQDEGKELHSARRRRFTFAKSRSATGLFLREQFRRCLVSAERVEKRG